MSATPASLAQGGSITATGQVKRTGGGVTQPAPAVSVRLYLQPAVGGSELLLGSTTTRTDGTYTLVRKPTQNGTVRARVVSVAGHANSTSASSTVAVAAGALLTPSTRTPRVGVGFSLRTAVTPAQVAPLRLEQSVAGGAWTQVQTASTASTGVWTFPVVRMTTGPVSYRVVVAATVKNGTVTSPATAVTVGP